MEDLDSALSYDFLIAIKNINKKLSSINNLFKKNICEDMSECKKQSKKTLKLLKELNKAIKDGSEIPLQADIK